MDEETISLQLAEMIHLLRNIAENMDRFSKFVLEVSPKEAQEAVESLEKEVQ